MIKTITIDSGKRFCKSTCDGKKILRFDSRIDTISQADYSYRNLIEFKNEYFILGSEAESVNFDSTKELMLHKLSAYYSVCNYISEHGEKVNLVINMPISQYMDVEQRDNFKKYIMGDKEIEMKICGKDYYFIINDVLIVAEGTGIIFSNPDMFRDKSTIICNVGGLNSTCLQVNNRKIVRSSPFSSNLGGNILESNIRKELNKNGKNNYQLHEIQYLFKSNSEHIKDVVAYCGHNLLEKIVTDMKARNYNIDGCENIYFEGGTSLRLKRIIEKRGFTVVEDPINQDIKGAHLYGVKIFAK